MLLYDVSACLSDDVGTADISSPLCSLQPPHPSTLAVSAHRLLSVSYHLLISSCWYSLVGLESHPYVLCAWHIRLSSSCAVKTSRVTKYIWRHVSPPPTRSPCHSAWLIEACWSQYKFVLSFTIGCSSRSIDSNVSASGSCLTRSNALHVSFCISTASNIFNTKITFVVRLSCVKPHSSSAASRAPFRVIYPAIGLLWALAWSGGSSGW